MLLKLCRSYMIRRQIKSLLKKDPLDLPKAYMRMGLPEPDRTKKVEFVYHEVGQYLDWVNAQVGAVLHGKNELPYMEVKDLKYFRIDNFLYDRTKSSYITFSDVMDELAKAYAVLSDVLNNKNHPKHYYVKDKVMRHVDTMHNTLVDIIKSI